MTKTLLGYYTQKQHANKEDSRCLGKLDALKWDCREDKVDLIFVPSLHQLSRNIPDSLADIKELRHMARPVGVFIEQINLYTLDPNAEMYLSLFAALAEEERRIKRKCKELRSLSEVT